MPKKRTILDKKNLYIKKICHMTHGLCTLFLTNEIIVFFVALKDDAKKLCYYPIVYVFSTEYISVYFHSDSSFALKDMSPPEQGETYLSFLPCLSVYHPVFHMVGRIQFQPLQFFSCVCCNRPFYFQGKGHCNLLEACYRENSKF